jgi:hypothetical protein
MRLTTLSDPILLLEDHVNKSKTILRESCDGLTLAQRQVVEGIYYESRYLIEASLTTQQVQQLFGEIEKGATAAGGNRTMLGKAVDVPGKVDDMLNKIGKYLQDTKPVQGFDSKFEKLKGNVSEKFPNLASKLTDMGSWAKENPGKTAAIIGVLTTLASLAGGPVGGAIAGQLLKGSLELIKGEKLSTAIGKGLKAAAVGWLAGKSMEAIGGMISSVVQELNPLPITGFSQFYQENIGNGLPNIFRDAEIVGTKEQLSQFNQMWSSAAKQWQNGDFDAAREAFSNAQTFASEVSSATYQAMGEDPGAKIKQLNDLFTGLAAAAQGAATGATGMDKKGQPVQGAKESLYIQQRPLSEGQVYLMFSKIQRLDEGPMDWMKKKAGNLTTKVTADKLSSAWKKAGSPTDSNELAAFLGTQGVDKGIIDTTFTAMQLPKPGTAAAPEAAPVDIEAVKKMIAALPTDRKARLLKFMQKDTAAAAPATASAAPATKPTEGPQPGQIEPTMA